MLTKHPVCARGYLDRSSDEGNGQRDPDPRPKVGPGCRSDLRVQTGRRDRRSKYWDIGTLSLRFPFQYSEEEEAERKKRVNQDGKEENPSLPRDTYRQFFLFLFL